MATDLSALGALRGYTQVEQPFAAAKPQKTGPKEAAEMAQRFAEVFDKADASVNALAEGRGSAQAVVEAMAQAEMALQAAVTIRDRVVEAYQEILRMPV